MGRAMGETPHRGFGFVLGWATILALGFSMLGFVAPTSGQASGVASHGEDRLSVKYVTGDLVIDLCKWEPMSCPRCEIEPWYCYGWEPCMIEPWLCIEVPEEFILAVRKNGSGAGTVSSSPSGIDCGNTCMAEFDEGSTVKLTAAAEPGSKFTGWSGACSGTDDCKVTMTQAREVTAQFDEETGPSNERTLILTKSPDPSTGKGVGTVSSKPKGIKCAQACTKAVGRLYKEQAVVLTAAPYGETSAFKEWKGTVCNGSTSLTCTVSMTG